MQAGSLSPFSMLFASFSSLAFPTHLSLPILFPFLSTFQWIETTPSCNCPSSRLYTFALFSSLVHTCTLYTSYRDYMCAYTYDHACNTHSYAMCAA
mmetsp:Transcript_20749/g.53508  ORF Transcript_20749/g.53508 Transcript_20749/m.53508 type:complete len:96 (-) Transcript_20749:80-367(-)